MRAEVVHVDEDRGLGSNRGGVGLAEIEFHY